MYPHRRAWHKGLAHSTAVYNAQEANMTSTASSRPGSASAQGQYEERSLTEMRVILEEHARRRSTTTYTGLARRMATIDFDMHIPTYRGLLGRMLDAIGEQTEAEGNGILPVLVVKKGTGRPSNGFFSFAEKAGRDVSDPDRLVLDETAKVFGAYELS
jgi:hypothetical protein